MMRTMVQPASRGLGSFATIDLLPKTASAFTVALNYCKLPHKAFMPEIQAAEPLPEQKGPSPTADRLSSSALDAVLSPGPKPRSPKGNSLKLTEPETAVWINDETITTNGEGDDVNQGNSGAFDLASFTSLSAITSDSGGSGSLMSDELMQHPPSTAAIAASSLPEAARAWRHQTFEKMERWRVKLYCMQDGAWHDLGTGLCWGSIDDTQCASIFVVDENASHRLLLKSRLTGNIGYQKHDTLIVWSERLSRDGVEATTELALSFQQTEGCLAVCDFILHVAQFVDSGVALFVVVNPRYLASKAARGEKSEAMARMPDAEESDSGSDPESKLEKSASASGSSSSTLSKANNQTEQPVSPDLSKQTQSSAPLSSSPSSSSSNATPSPSSGALSSSEAEATERSSEDSTSSASAGGKASSDVYRCSSSVASEDTTERVTIRPIMPPLPLADNIESILDSVCQTARSQYGRDALAVFMRQRKFIPGLVALFNALEGYRASCLVPAANALGSDPRFHGQRKLDILRQMSALLRVLFGLAEIDVITMLAEESTFTGIIGILEYDIAFAPKKASFRDYVSSHTRLSEIILTDDTCVTDKLGETYRLQLMRDVILARLVDDTILSLLGSLIFMNQMDLVSWLQTNSDYSTRLFKIYRFPKEDSHDLHRRRDTILRFVCQVFATLRGLPAPQRAALTGTMIEHGLLAGIKWGLCPAASSASHSMALEAVLGILDTEAPLLHSVELKLTALKASEFSGEVQQLPVARALARVLVEQRHGNIQVQAFEALKSYLDSPAEPELERNFYELVAPSLFGALGRNNLTPWTYELLLELLEFCSSRHAYCLAYVQNSGILHHIARHIREPVCKGAALAAVKTARTLIFAGDTAQVDAIAENGILSATLDLLESQGVVSNATNSACLQLIALVATEPGQKYISLRRWLVHARESQLRRLNYYSVLAYLRVNAGMATSPSNTTDVDDSSSDELRQVQLKRSSRGSVADLSQIQRRRRLGSVRSLGYRESCSDSGSNSNTSSDSTQMGSRTPKHTSDSCEEGSSNQGSPKRTPGHGTVVRSPPIEQDIESPPLMTPGSPSRCPKLDDARRASFDVFQLDNSPAPPT